MWASSKPKKDICNNVAAENLKEMFSWLRIYKPRILLSTGKRWLVKMEWHYGKLKNDMYINRHK